LIQPGGELPGLSSTHINFASSAEPLTSIHVRVKSTGIGSIDKQAITLIGMRMAFNLAEQYVQQAEVALGATLPRNYRVTMMESNGGELDVRDDDWELIPIRDSSDRKRLARSCNDIVAETKSFRDWNGFPADVVVIAKNDSGDCIVFRREGDIFHPAPHIWNHETRTLLKIGDDFSELE
jgi:hypothetical protein